MQNIECLAESSESSGITNVSSLLFVVSWLMCFISHDLNAALEACWSTTCVPKKEIVTAHHILCALARRFPEPGATMGFVGVRIRFEVKSKWIRPCP